MTTYWSLDHLQKLVCRGTKFEEQVVAMLAVGKCICVSLNTFTSTCTLAWRGRCDEIILLDEFTA